MTRVLTSIEAAGVLRLHPATVREYARDGKIPACPLPGGDWRFIESDLLDYIRGLYEKPAKPCLSTNVKALRTGGPILKFPASLDYVDRLEQRIAAKRSASTTNGKRNYGG